MHSLFQNYEKFDKIIYFYINSEEKCEMNFNEIFRLIIKVE
jgi:hypothetical protein